MRTDFDQVFSETLPEFVRTQKRSPGAGLALSGGGYRAMLFHVGALRRLHEVGALGQLERISSVSGGSIAAAQLALSWDALSAADGDPAAFTRLVETPLLKIADTLVDVGGGLRGMLTPRRSIASTIAKTYDEWFDHKTLADLPDSVEFVFCATNLGTGSLMRFTKHYMADYRVGMRPRPKVPLGQVVAASAAFPPVLSPLRIELAADQALTEQFAGDTPAFADTDYASTLELSDGGVYDNLGLQPLNKFATLLVSDGGGPFREDQDVPANWLGHMIRCWKVADNQVRSLRRSNLIEDFTVGSRRGAFWGISTTHAAYGPTALVVHDSWTEHLRSISTRLAPMDDDQKLRLINFGYAQCDAALQSRLVRARMDPPATFPHPQHRLDQLAPASKKTPFWKFWRG